MSREESKISKLILSFPRVSGDEPGVVLMT